MLFFFFSDVPAIVVFEDTPSTPPPVSSRDITSARRSSGTGSWTGTEPETPTQRDGFDMSDLVLGDGPTAGPSSRGGLRRGRMRHSDGSALSADLGLRYTYVAFFFFGSVHSLVFSTNADCASRADVIFPCTVIRRSRPRPRTTTTTTIRCRIHLGEVSFTHQRSSFNVTQADFGVSAHRNDA
jgi:hypothetical protein